MLWFDVEEDRDTSVVAFVNDMAQLWFDVEEDRDTSSGTYTFLE